MFTRQFVTGQYHGTQGLPPPLHVAMPYHQQAAGLTRDQMYGAVGAGLMGGAAAGFAADAPTGMAVGDTGYGYLGMDPSSPQTWVRKFNPAPGMIGRLNAPQDAPFRLYPIAGSWTAED
jgi:hypothetical protein